MLSAAMCFCRQVPQPITQFYPISSHNSPFFVLHKQESRNKTLPTLEHVWCTNPNQTSSIHPVPSTSPRADEEAKVTKVCQTTPAGTHYGLESVEPQVCVTLHGNSHYMTCPMLPRQQYVF